MSAQTIDREKAIDFDAAYSVRGYRGVAFYLLGWEQVWAAELCFCEDGEGNEWEEETGEGEWIDDPSFSRVVAVMVGDDRKQIVHVNDLTVLDEEDYCPGCGQIGCGCYR